MKLIDTLFGLFSPKSYAIGVLDDNLQASHSGFSQAVFEERRRCPRTDVSVPVWFRVLGGEAKWLLGKTVNHSEAGIRLALPPGVAPGMEIDLRVKLPDSKKPVNIKGIVIWVEPISDCIRQRSTVECGVAFKK